MKKKADAEESNRMWASASFVGVLIIIGLPLWWKTTEVYRVALPFEEIDALDPEAQTVTSEVFVYANDAATAADIAGLVEKEFEDIDILKIRVTHGVLSKELHYSLDSAADNQDAVEEVGSTLDLTQPNRIYVVQRKPLAQLVWLGSERLMFFRDNNAGPTIAKALKDWVFQPSVLSGSVSAVADPARRVRVPPGPGYHVVLYTRHADDKLPGIVDDYIGSFLDELSVLHNFTLKSQWLYQLNFDFQATEVKDSSEWGRHFKVRSDRLHLLLTRLEERAASASELPTINLVLYHLPCHVAPLVIYEGDSPVESPIQAFISPKWGGVVFVSPPAAHCREGGGDTPWPVDLRLAMGTFIAQLRTLLGIADTEPIPDAQLFPLRSVTPRRWELDAVVRARALQHVAAAQHTLRSLAQLLGEISNIVINDEVGASIKEAMSAIAQCRQQLAAGALQAAAASSGRAAAAAESAFMHPTLLALLYFPDDQKYAIYIPLFLPIMFPVVLSLKNLFLWFRGKPVHKDKSD